MHLNEQACAFLLFLLYIILFEIWLDLFHSPLQVARFNRFKQIQLIHLIYLKSRVKSLSACDMAFGVSDLGKEMKLVSDEI